jgi:hypothetical protein
MLPAPGFMALCLYPPKTSVHLCRMKLYNGFSLFTSVQGFQGLHRCKTPETLTERHSAQMHRCFPPTGGQR